MKGMTFILVRSLLIACLLTTTRCMAIRTWHIFNSRFWQYHDVGHFQIAGFFSLRKSWQHGLGTQIMDTIFHQLRLSTPFASSGLGHHYFDACLINR